MKKTFKIILIILAYANLFYVITTCIRDDNLNTVTVYDNSNLLYIRDVEHKILHSPNCALVEDLDDFGGIFTDNGYFMAKIDGYVHCYLCFK